MRLRALRILHRDCNLRAIACCIRFESSRRVSSISAMRDMRASQDLAASMRSSKVDRSAVFSMSCKCFVSSCIVMVASTFRSANDLALGLGGGGFCSRNAQLCFPRVQGCLDRKHSSQNWPAWASCGVSRLQLKHSRVAMRLPCNASAEIRHRFRLAFLSPHLLFLRPPTPLSRFPERPSQ